MRFVLAEKRNLLINHVVLRFGSPGIFDKMLEDCDTLRLRNALS